MNLLLLIELGFHLCHSSDVIFSDLVHLIPVSLLHFLDLLPLHLNVIFESTFGICWPNPHLWRLELAGLVNQGVRSAHPSILWLTTFFSHLATSLATNSGHLTFCRWSQPWVKLIEAASFWGWLCNRWFCFGLLFLFWLCLCSCDQSGLIATTFITITAAFILRWVVVSTIGQFSIKVYIIFGSIKVNIWASYSEVVSLCTFLRSQPCICCLWSQDSGTRLVRTSITLGMLWVCQ